MSLISCTLSYTRDWSDTDVFVDESIVTKVEELFFSNVSWVCIVILDILKASSCNCLHNMEYLGKIVNIEFLTELRHVVSQLSEFLMNFAGPSRNLVINDVDPSVSILKNFHILLLVADMLPHIDQLLILESVVTLGLLLITGR